MCFDRRPLDRLRAGLPGATGCWVRLRMQVPVGRNQVARESESIRPEATVEFLGGASEPSGFLTPRWWLLRP